MAKLIPALLALLALLTGCRNQTVDMDALRAYSGTMLTAENSNWGIVDMESDHWCGTDFAVDYSGTVRVTVNYNLSGAVVDCEAALSDEDYRRLAEIVVNDFAGGKCDKEIDACDGTGWHIAYYDTDGNLAHDLDGYIYGIRPLEEMQDILESYIPEYERPPLYPED